MPLKKGLIPPRQRPRVTPDDDDAVFLSLSNPNVGREGESPACRFAPLLPIVLSSWSSSFLALLDMAHYGLLLRRRCQAEGPLHTLALCPSNMLDKHFRILQGEAGSFRSSSGNLPNDKPVVKESFRMSQIKPWIKHLI